MRPLLFLAILGFVGNVAYGFSSSPRPLVIAASTTTTRKMPSSTRISRGGAAVSGDSSSSSSSSSLRKWSTLCSSLWGTTGVMYILVKAIRRVLPIALEPFLEQTTTPLTLFQLGSYVVTSLWFAYVEGYKGFQLGFAPLVVARSFTIHKFHHLVLAPFYSMGLFHATPKRIKVSWGVTLGVATIVAAVKRLPFPWRNIVDAGVVVGLSWGTMAIFVLYVKALWQNKPPEMDPALPVKTTNAD